MQIVYHRSHEGRKQWAKRRMLAHLFRITSPTIPRDPRVLCKLGTTRLPKPTWDLTTTNCNHRTRLVIKWMKRSNAIQCGLVAYLVENVILKHELFMYGIKSHYDHIQTHELITAASNNNKSRTWSYLYRKKQSNLVHGALPFIYWISVKYDSWRRMQANSYFAKAWTNGIYQKVFGWNKLSDSPPNVRKEKLLLFSCFGKRCLNQTLYFLDK